MPSTTATEQRPRGGPGVDHRIEVPGAVLAVADEGAGAPVVLLHGWPLDGRAFAPQRADLAVRYRVVTPDRRGFGRSTGRPCLAAELDDLDAVLDALALGPVHLVGMSQGGRVALRYAVTRPERLLSLVLQGAPVDGAPIDEPEHERIPFAEYQALARAGEFDALRAAWCAHPLMNLAAEPGRTRAAVETMLADYEGQDLVDFRPEDYAFDIDVDARLPTLGLPVLVVTGERESASRQAHAARICARVPDARHVVVSGAGHLCNLSAHEAYDAALATFLEQVRER